MERRPIRWLCRCALGKLCQNIGLCRREQLAKQAAADRIEQKKSRLEGLALQFLALRNLMVRRSGFLAASFACQERNSDAQVRSQHKGRLFFPLIMVNTAPTTDIICQVGGVLPACPNDPMLPQMPEERTTIAFSYSNTFAIHDDNVLLQQLGQEDAKDPRNIPEGVQLLLLVLHLAPAFSAQALLGVDLPRCSCPRDAGLPHGATVGLDAAGRRRP